MGTTKFSTVKDALLPTLAQIWRNGLSTIFFLLSPSTAAATVYILEQYKLLYRFFWEKNLQYNGFDIFCDIDCLEVTGPNQLYDLSTGLLIIFF